MKTEKLIELKKRIISTYEKDPKIKNKINLDMQAKNIPDQSMEQFKNEVFESLKNRISENKDMDENVEEFESAVVDFENDTIFDLGLLEKIDEKVLIILQYLNIGLFNKIELKNKIISDMLEYLYELVSNEDIKTKIISRIPGSFLRNELMEKMKKINDYFLKKFLANCYPKRKNNIERILTPGMTIDHSIKLWYVINSIPWYIENHIDHEFQEYELKKRQIKKDLLKDLIEKIMPELNIYFEEHKKNRLKNINERQMLNFNNFVFDYLDNKYIKVDKRNKKLNNEDYLFLRSKVKRFINERYVSFFIKGAE
jgi:hypothetical protein